MNIYRAMYCQMAADPIGWNYLSDGTISKSTEGVLIRDVQLLTEREFNQLRAPIPSQTKPGEQFALNLE